jgi:hypothetical protein
LRIGLNLKVFDFLGLFLQGLCHYPKVPYGFIMIHTLMTMTMVPQEKNSMSMKTPFSIFPSIHLLKRSSKVSGPGLEIVAFNS